MKRLFFVLQIFLFIAFNFSLLLAGYQLASSSQSFVQTLGQDKPQYDLKEEFDPSLQTINNLDKLVAFCDGLYTEKASTNSSIHIDEIYPDIVSSVIRKRFYHGYSMYGLSNNYMATMVSDVTVEGLNAIVVPDDILKYPYAACSQQSIVFMEILRKKGFPTRKVGFKGKDNGHFCFEVYYNSGWHFYDPDMEPNVAVLNAYNRPSIAFLTENPEILLKAYHQYPREKTLDIFMNYSYGAVNTFAAPKAMIFQKATKIFSYIIWLFFLIAFIIVRKKYLRLSRQHVRNNGVHLPRIQQGTPQVYYPNYSAQGA
jgi:hypothetical protein